MNDQQQSRADALTDEHIATLKLAARAVTPQDIDGAERIESRPDGSYITCPACEGEGCIPFESDYCNYDHVAIGVQFYGVGTEPGAAEAYFRAAKPATILALLDRLERAESALAAPPVEQPAAAPADKVTCARMGHGVVSIGECFSPELEEPGIICMELPEQRDIGLDTGDVFPKGLRPPADKILAYISFANPAAIDQTIDVLQRIKAKHFPTSSQADERAECIAWAIANGFTKYHESMCAAWEERARRAAASAAPADERAALPQIPDLVKATAWLTMCLRTELSRLDDDTHKALDEVEAQLSCVRAITNGAIDYESMVAARAAASPAAAIPAAVLNALRFYANGHHFNIDNDHQQFDTVSGEPQNWLCSERDGDCTMIEDGSIAKTALCGGVLGFEEPEKPVEGEVFTPAPQPAHAEAASPAAEAVPDDCDVRKILLNVVPGMDGEGHEVYARNVADVEQLLSEMGERLDAFESTPQPAQADAPAEAREPIAWVTDDDRAITAAQKQRALADGGATASSVRPYSVPCYAVSAPADAGEARLTDAARDMLAERRRQVEAEGWTPEHDDQYQHGAIALAAACYAANAGGVAWADPLPSFWPWMHNWWKPTTPRRDLVKAGALILAELERLDRAALLNGADHDR